MAGAQFQPALQTLTPLADFVGTYAYAEGVTGKLEIAADAQGRLFAVLDEANYPLKITGRDELTNSGGNVLPFRRGADGQISGFVEDGRFNARLSGQVSPMAVLDPWPQGGAYVYAPPADMRDGIAVGNIASTPLGMDTAKAIAAGVIGRRYPDVHGVLLYQGGRLVLEQYFYGYSMDRQQQLRSATKSFVSALAGIAIDQGALSLDTRALSRLNLSSYDNPDPRKPAITVRDFLTMRSGLDCNDYSDNSPGRETVLDFKPDWPKAMFDLRQIHDPGKAAFYCSGGVSVVGRAIENSVHASLPEFADRTLFTPLGIKRDAWRWNYDLTNNDKEFSQIHMRPRDMLKLGMLYADGGRWRGRQIISKAWITASLGNYSTVDNTEYGYFWWRPRLDVDGAHIYVSAAKGNGGQKIYVLPEYHLVAVFTGGNFNSESPMNDIMIHDILPKLMKAYPNVVTRP